MSQNSEPPYAPRNVAQFSLAALLLVILLAAVFFAGLGFLYRKTMVLQQVARAEAEMARAAEMMAREQAQQAMAAAQSAKAAALQSPSPTETADAQATIEAVLQDQSEAWNQGDLDRFMEHYWKSDQLTFSSGGQTTRGWEATLARYRQRYPTREKMGQLSFDGLEFHFLGDSAALVLGRWRLERDGDTPSGNFSLVLQQIDGRWLIVHDHTSVTKKPASD